MCAVKAADDLVSVADTQDVPQEKTPPKTRRQKTTTRIKSTRKSPTKKSASTLQSEALAVEETQKTKRTRRTSRKKTDDSSPQFVVPKETLEQAYRDKELLDEYAALEEETQAHAKKKNLYSFGSSGTGSSEAEISSKSSNQRTKQPNPGIFDKRIEKEMQLVEEFLESVTPDDFSEDPAEPGHESNKTDTYYYPPENPPIHESDPKLVYDPHRGIYPVEESDGIDIELPPPINRPELSSVEKRQTNAFYPNYVGTKGETKGLEATETDQLFEQEELTCSSPTYQVSPEDIFTMGMDVPRAVVVPREVRPMDGTQVPKYTSVLPGMPRPFSDHSSGKQLGREGEALAARYLAARGYLILEMNWRSKIGEVDIVCEQGDTTVLVEVKTRRARNDDIDIWPELNFDANKSKKYMHMISEYRTQFKGCKNIRVDVIGIVVMHDHCANLRHLLNVFDGWEFDNGKYYSGY